MFKNKQIALFFLFTVCKVICAGEVISIDFSHQTSKKSEKYDLNVSNPLLFDLYIKKVNESENVEIPFRKSKKKKVSIHFSNI